MFLLLIACSWPEPEQPSGSLPPDPPDGSGGHVEPGPTGWLELTVYEGEEVLAQHSSQALECYVPGLTMYWWGETEGLTLDMGWWSEPGRYELEAWWDEGLKDWGYGPVCWIDIVDADPEATGGEFRCFLEGDELVQPPRELEGSFQCAYVMEITW